MTRATTTLFWFSLTLFVSLCLYHTSYRVEELDRQLRSINSEIEAEGRNLHVLKAEWVYLANPARIEDAARKHLDMKPTSPQQLTRLGKISDVIPTRREMVAKATTASQRIASAAPAPRPIAAAPQMAAEETGRINTRLVIQKTASLATLSNETPFKLVGDKTYALANSGTDQ